MHPLLALLLCASGGRLARAAGGAPSYSGAHHCCVGQHLTILVYDTDNEIANFLPDIEPAGAWEGLLPNLYHALSLEMGFTYSFLNSVSALAPESRH